jgi:heptosyltransferase III
MYSELPPACGVIIHPGAVGDCLLTLPLAAYMKKNLGLARLDFIGHMDYIEFYPGRTCIDRVRSLESIQMHRFFDDESAFVLEDKDRLAIAFESYEQIVSFLGHGHPHFEYNLLFCVHSTHSAEVTLLPLAPAQDDPTHVAEFYQSAFAREQGLEQKPGAQATGLNASEQGLNQSKTQPPQTVTPFPSDFSAGQDLLEQAGVDTEKPLVIIQPGSGSKEKCWHLDNFLHVAGALKSEGLETAFLIGPVEQERFATGSLKRLHDSGPVLSGLTLTKVLQALTQVELFCGNDSGISHLSAAMGKKTVALFGPAGRADHYRPLGPNVTVLRPDPQSFAQPSPQEAENVLRDLVSRL